MVKVWKPGELIEERYKIQEVVTTGGMGIVYFVLDQKHPIRLAVKSLRPDLPLNVPRVRRFLREAEIWTNLDVHPHIVQAKTISRFSESTPLIFLEFVNGNTLKDLMEQANGSMPLLNILDYSIQCCTGMTYTHRKGFLHRDLKPANLLVTRSGVLKITDFGISRAFREIPEQDEEEAIINQNFFLTSSGVAMGTAPYMSPEQLMGSSNISSASDIFSFGVILYELLTGHLPFVGKTPFEVKKSQASSPALPSGFFLNRPFPSKLDELILACLTIDPAFRLLSFADVEKILIEVYETVKKTESKNIQNANDLELQNAFELVNQKKYEAAISLLNNVKRKDPRNYNAWHLMGNRLMDLAGEIELTPSLNFGPDAEKRFLLMTDYSHEAIQCAERAIDLGHPKSEWAWNTKAACLMRIGYFHRALGCFNQAIERNMSYAVAWRNQSHCFRKLGQFQKALESYQRSLILGPQNPNALNGKGVCLALLSRYNEALECFSKALSVAPQHFQARENLNLWSRIAAGERNMVVLTSGHEPDVQEHLEKVLNLKTQSRGISGRPARDQEASELGDRAWGLMNLELFDAALLLTYRALEIDPMYSTTLLQQGRILRRMNRLDEAVNSFTAALAVDPPYVLIHLNRGLAFSSLGRYEEAIADYQVYLESEPNDPSAFSNLGYTYSQIGNLEKALDAFVKALELAPQYHQALFGKSQTHLLRNELSIASQTCQQALAIDPLSADTWFLAGQIAQKQSQYDEATKAYKRVIDIKPQHYQAWVCGAQCMNLGTQLPEDVLKWCEKASDVGFVDLREINENRAYALYRDRRYQDAMEQYDLLLSQFPDDSNLQMFKELCLTQIEMDN